MESSIHNAYGVFLNGRCAPVKLHSVERDDRQVFLDALCLSKVAGGGAEDEESGMIPVRFQEYERYDIRKDAEVVMFTATTSKGCYHAEVTKGGFKTIRENRTKFRDKAIDLIVNGKDPCEVVIG